MKVTYSVAWLGMATLIVSAAGCGGSGPPKAYPATGEVIYKGAPLADAQVAFIPTEGQGRMSRGTTDADGRFELGAYQQKDGALAGEHQVTVAKVVPSVKNDPYAPMKSVIPEKYNGVTTSPLKATVSASEKNHFRFELVD